MRVVFYIGASDVTRMNFHPDGMKIDVSPPSSRRQATVHRTVAFNCSSHYNSNNKDHPDGWSLLFGASDVTRTRDLLITSEMHYRLCYTSNLLSYYIGFAWKSQLVFPVA